MPYAVFFLLTLCVVLADQAVKCLVLKVLPYGASIPLVKGFASLTLVFNTGAAFGILRGVPFLFLALPAVTAVLILILFFKSGRKKGFALSLGLLLGGTVGNLIDRLRYGYVVDFLDIYFRRYHWPAFNVADMCICAGVFLFFLRLGAFSGKRMQKGNYVSCVD